MIKSILLCFIFSCVYIHNSPNNFVKSFEPKWVNSPNTISKWFKSFKYQPERFENFKKPNITINDRGGDCEDFAILTCHILKKHEYKCKLVFMFGSFGGHAIAVYQNNFGKWNSFDNGKHYLNNKTNIRQILETQYNKWDKAFILNDPTIYYNFIHQEKYINY